MGCREGRNGRGAGGEVIWGLELMICLSYIENVQWVLILYIPVFGPKSTAIVTQIFP